MPAEAVLGLIIFFVSYIGTALLMIELLMWAMRRLDNPAAPSRSQMTAVQRKLASTISVQANLAAYLPEHDGTGSLGVDQFACPGTPVPQFELSQDFDELALDSLSAQSGAEAAWMSEGKLSL